MDSKAPSGGGVRPPLPPKGDSQGAPPPQPPPRKNKRSGFGFSKKDQVRKRGVEVGRLAVSVADCMSYLRVCVWRGRGRCTVAVGIEVAGSPALCELVWPASFSFFTVFFSHTLYDDYMFVLHRKYIVSEIHYSEMQKSFWNCHMLVDIVIAL